MKFVKYVIVFLISLLLNWQIIPIALAEVSEADKAAVDGGYEYYDQQDQCQTAANNPSSPGKIFIVGDSIIAPGGGQTAIEQAVQQKGGGWSVVIDGLVSRGLVEGPTKPNDGMKAIADHAADIKDSKAVVIELGTNPPALNAGNIKAAIDAVKATGFTVKIYWVNNAYKGDPSHFASNNQALQTASSANGFTVIDWQSIASQHPEYFSNDPYNVHPIAGFSEYANLIINAVTGGGNPTAGSTPAGFNPDPTAKGQFDAIKPKVDEYSAVWKQVAQEKSIKAWWIYPSFVIREYGRVLQTGQPLANPGNNDHGVYQNIGKHYGTGNVLSQDEFFQQTRDISDLIWGKAKAVGADLSQDISDNNALAKIGAAYKSGEGSPWFTNTSVYHLEDHPYAWAGFNADKYKIPMNYPSYANWADEHPSVQITVPGFVTMMNLFGSGGGSSGSSTCLNSAASDTPGAQDITASRAEMVERLYKNANFQPTNDSVKADIDSGAAQDGAVKLMLQMVEQYNKPVKIELVKGSQPACLDFAQGATDYGSYTSSHWYGLAVDVHADGTSPEASGLVKWVYKNKVVLNIGELEHSPVIEGTSNIKFGGDYQYPEKIQMGHIDHVHVAVKGTGSIGPNCTPKPGGEKVD